ncbi:hyperosmolarity resistance protein Ebh [Staphylococcus warneri]|uniref:hyperosmolarity resistance protein Ebh n=1 Tax=Staphylococcus warneri TaxID=1292 RepID=UPI003F68A352
MNNREKLQKFSIRKYTVGTFSTVIATLVFLGFNASHAQAEELNTTKTASQQLLHQQDEVNDDSKSNTDSSIANQLANEQTSDETITSEQPSKETVVSQTHKDPTDTQTIDNVSTDNENSIQTTDQTANSNHSNDLEQNNQSHSAEVNNVENKLTANVDNVKHQSIEQESNLTQPAQLNKDSLQAFFDANYHDYRFIDRDKVDQPTYDQVKQAFDKVNTLLGNNNPISEKSLQLAYQDLEQAVATIRTLPKRQSQTRRNHHIQERAAESRSSGSYQSAITSYYVDNPNDGSGYPEGTYIYAANKGTPFSLPNTPWKRLRVADSKGIAYVVTKRLKDGYEWTIKFNQSHQMHEHMVFWFGLPDGQTPVGPARLSIEDPDNSNIVSSLGVGAGEGQPLPFMWRTAGGIDSSRASNFVQGPRTGYTFYDEPTIHINSFKEFARAPEFQHEQDASDNARTNGEQNFALLNGEFPNQITGLDRMYAFIGKGNASYTLQFRTQGNTASRFYYAAGGRALEYRQLFSYNELYVEPLNHFTERVKDFTLVTNRTYHLGNYKNVYDLTLRRDVTKFILDSNDENSEDFATDPLSYVRTPSPLVIGFFDPNLPSKSFRHGPHIQLNDYQIYQLINNETLINASRSGNPIKLNIGFSVQDRYGNDETLMPVYLYVKPELQNNMGFFTNNDPNNRAESPESKSAGHPVFNVFQGNMGNSYTSSGNTSNYVQPLRIQLASNEDFSNNDWEITGIPSTLHIENAAGRTNNNRERNLELVGNIAPGDYSGIVRLRKREQPFEIRVKPLPPQIDTTVRELRGKGGTKPTITVSNVPADPNALVYLVATGNLAQDGTNDPASVPKNYDIIASATPTSTSNSVTFNPEDYVQNLPNTGVIRAIVYYNKKVVSNFSNAVEIQADNTPPTIGNPVDLKNKYYKGEQVNFTIDITDGANGTGIKSVNVSRLPQGWTSQFVQNANGEGGTLRITGNVSDNQPFNSQIRFNVSATDNSNNTTNSRQSKQIAINIGQMSNDFSPIVLPNVQKINVVNPGDLTRAEERDVINALKAVNTNIIPYLEDSSPINIPSTDMISFNYKDGSTDRISITNAITYEPVRKSIYAEGNNTKEATVTIARGQQFEFGDLKQYFALSNGADMPESSLFTITAVNALPNSSQISQLGVGTYTYQLNASDAYRQDQAPLTLKLKVVDVNQPTGDQRVYRISTFNVTDDEKAQIKQAFINANSSQLQLTDSNIEITNTLNRLNTSTITVNITKGKLQKSFTSNATTMNFLRWVDFPNDYSVGWTSQTIPGRQSDGGFQWSSDHKSLIYRYDATSGRTINANDVLKLITANTTIPGLRTNIRGTEKALAEAGGTPNYNPVGYSLTAPDAGGQREFTYNGKIIQALDLVETSRGYGGQPISYSNLSSNKTNSSLTNVNESARNGVPAFTIDHVIKNNTITGNNSPVYRAQLFLSPYGPPAYLQAINSNQANTTDVINVYFVPSDSVNPTLTVGNYSNHVVYSGETFTNNITANDNYALGSVQVAPNSQIAGTVSNNNQTVSLQAPNVSTSSDKTITLVATDTSGNTTNQSFNVTVKPLKDKYRVTTNATVGNPIRIANIRDNATISQADQQKIIDSITTTNIAGTRPYATAGANEIRSKVVTGNVGRLNQSPVATVTVTFADGSTSTVTVPVKHILYNVVASPRYTIQGQDFPNGKGASPNDFFTLENGDPVPDATITWLPNNTPNKNNTRIGESITVRANILFDGETTPIIKESSYMVVRSIPKQVFVTNRVTPIPGIDNPNNPKDYLKPIIHSWDNDTQQMNFAFVGNGNTPPNLNIVGSQTRLVRVTYANGQSENVRFLVNVRPDAPRIDSNTVLFKAGLTNQEIKINNVLNQSPVTLLKSDGTSLAISHTNYGPGHNATVVVSDALPDGEIKAKTSVTTRHISYTTQNNQGQVQDVTQDITVDSFESDPVRVTPQLHAIPDGAHFIKDDTQNDFSSAARYIDQLPQGATAVWQDNADNWKNNVGNFTKTAVVTLPNGQGTRNVDIPVKIYPVARAKAPTREVQGGQLSQGTDALHYVTFDPNTNTNGITADWANQAQPSTSQPGVQNLTINVTYPGITTPVQVPVSLNVYQFDFSPNEYTTTIGTTFARGIEASQYQHIVNNNGLPTEGFTYHWNQATTGTNGESWEALNKPNSAQVLNAKYDVLYNGQPFATSQPARFIIRNVQPSVPQISESKQGVITIAPGANQSINTRTGNVDTYADRLVIKHNGQVITTFIRNNSNSPWTKETSAQSVNGVVGTENGITIAAGTFSPSDNIQVIATQGNGELISDEQPSQMFTVVAPQPNQATSHIWENGQVEIAPNNLPNNLVNQTTAVEITYIEQVSNTSEQTKTLQVVQGPNGQWSIADKPSYVTVDSATGKVTFNANTIKPNSDVTTIAKAGSGNAESTNTNTYNIPNAHTVTINQIVKDYGSNVTPEDINNAVQVINKQNATIKQGTPLPVNLAGGSTTTIPVVITYDDGSTEQITETIFTKSDKRDLISAVNHLDDPISTDGKTPASITQFNNAMTNAQSEINTAITQADQVIQDQFASPEQVTQALNTVQAAQAKIDQAKALLQNKADNHELVQAKNDLQASIDQQPSLDGMTQQSIDNYNAKRQAAQSEITKAQQVIDNGDATAQQIAEQKQNVDKALTALNQAKSDLTADTSALQQAVQQLDRTGTTTGMRPASITAYNQAMQALNPDLTQARQKADAIINKPIRTVQEVQDALRQVDQVNERITQAINQLQPLANNSELKTAKAKLDDEINQTVSTDGMTTESINAYQQAKQAAQAESEAAQQVINNGDATEQDIANEKAKVEDKYNALKQAIANLTPDVSPLERAKADLENDINQTTSTTGMTDQSVANYNEKLNAAKQQLQEINQILQSHPNVATIRDYVAHANDAKSVLDTARNGLTVDKTPLENAKNALQQSINQVTDTTGMTQDSINTYQAKLNAAKEKLSAINQVLNSNPTVDQINTNTTAANDAKAELDDARSNLTPDQAPLQQAKVELQEAINQAQGTDTTGMTQDSINALNDKLNAAKEKIKEIDHVLNNHPTVALINDSVNQATTTKEALNEARQNLVPDKAPLEAAKNALQQSINQPTNTTGMTQSSIDAYNEKLEQAKAKLASITQVLNGSPSVGDINSNKNEANIAKDALNQARQQLTVDKAPLQQAKMELEQSINQPTDTNGMTQESVANYNSKVNAAREKLREIEQVLNGNPTVDDINNNTSATNNVTNALNQARQQLTVDKAPLEAAKDALQQSINTADNTDTNGMTQDSINTFNDKLNAAKEKLEAIKQVLNGNPTVQDINTNVAQANTVKSDLDQAQAHLTPDKAPLEAAKNSLEASINQPTDTDGMTSASLEAYHQELGKARQTLNELNQLIAGQPTVAEIKAKVAQAQTNEANLNHARSNLTLDRQPTLTSLQNATSLNDAQRNRLEEQINAAPNHAALVALQNDINQLNHAMTKLRDSIADNDQLKTGINYIDATPSIKSSYDNAVDDAKGTIDSQTQPIMDPTTINQQAENVKSSQAALDGQQNLQRAKDEATAIIVGASDLNQAQKNALIQQVSKAQNVQQANDIKQNADDLNNAMTALKQGIANHDQLIQSDNYVNANPELKTAYNNKYDQAKAIVEGTGQSPILTPNEVNHALKQVTFTEQALNGNTNLNNAKQQALTALGQLTHLNQAQRQALETQINDAHQIDTVNNAKELANNIDGAMANLQQSIANKEDVKQGEDYIDAEQQKQLNYNDAVTNAETIINETSQPTLDVNTINQATNNVTQTKDALDGEERLDQAKTTATTALDGLTHLNQAQKANLTDNINHANRIADIEQLTQTANDLNQAMSDLQNGINNENTVLNSQNYQDASPDNKANYTTAVQAAKDILNQAGPNKNKAQVEEALRQVQNAEQALNGTQNLDQAKQNAKQQLNSLTSLTDAQKAQLTQDIDNGQTVSDVQGIENNADTLNQAMDTLRQSIADQTTVKDNEDYHDASPDQQQAYNAAVTDAENIINTATNPEMNPDAINNKAQQVISAKTKLNGDENLEAAKQDAKQYLDTLGQITDQQKANLLNQIKQSPHISDVNQVKQAANDLNQAMQQLQAEVNQAPQVKTTENYTDADQPKQSDYDQSVTTAEAILDQANGPNTSQDKVEEALQRIVAAKKALNGDQKLNDTKASAQQYLGTLTHLTDAQRQAFEANVNQANHIADVNQIKQEAQSLDDAMEQLNTLVNNQPSVQATQNYLDADQSKQSDYDMYLVTAQGIVNQQSGPNTPMNEVQNLINQINQAQQALNGERNLEDAKRNAMNTISNSADLNDAQKDALKAQVSNGKRVADVKAIEQLATEINNNMTSLKEAIADKNDTLTSGNYINASGDKQQAYTNQVDNAEAIINGTQGAVLIPSEISNATSQVNAAKQDLNGDENLREAKQNATTAIDGLTSLNDAQRDQLKQQIALAQTLPDINTTQNKATVLNDAMHKLRDSIANASNIKTSQNYTDANQNLQDAYNSQVDNANGIVNPIASPTMDPDAITQAASQVTTAEKALNGTENLRHAQQDALTHLDSLSHLTDAQKADLTQQINQATHVSDVTATQNSANDLNTAMDQLNQAIANQQAIKQLVNYTDANNNLKENYSNAVKEAQQILDKTNGPNTSQTDVVAAMQKVQTAEQALNGNQNVEHAKTQALADLEHLTSLNNAQKEALTQQINDATTVADVNQQSDNATELNTAMSQLQDGIANKQQILDSQNYTDAEPSKQQAYNQAISNGEQLLDKEHGQNLDKDAVAQALAQVTSTKDALDGTQILEQAKTNATNAINDLQNLTNIQKDELKRQIQQAQNVANVDNVKTQSQTLDQAMQVLRQSIQDNPSIKTGQNYLDASNNNQNDYNTAIDQANAIIDATSQPNMSATEINQAATKVNETKAALNGEQNLIQAKEAAKHDIGQMNHLNQNQINTLNDQVQQANDIAAVNALKDSATSLNTVMGQLKDTIANHNDVQQSVNYTDADTDKQQAYDNAVSQAEAITDPTNGTNATQSQVEAAIAKVKAAQQDLNGNRKVEEAKAAAKQALSTYANLNHAQVNTATQHINDAQTLEAVTQAQQEANTLNNAMGQLQQGIAYHQDVEQSVDYTDADTDKQQAYTDTVTQAQSILDKDHGNDLTQSQVEQALAKVNQAQQDLNGEEKVQEAKIAAIQELGTYSNLNHAQTNTAQDRINNAQTLAEVEQAIENVNHAKQELNGEEKVSEAKINALQTLDNDTHLNQHQREAAKNNINGATTLSQVAQAIDQANALNTVMGQLKDSISDQATIKQQINYTDADTDRKTNYDDAVTNAQAILDPVNGNNLSKEQVESAINQVNTTKDQLNGNTNLQNAKNEANTQLNALDHINHAQSDNLRDQIATAPSVEAVHQIEATAQALDQAMQQLQQAIANRNDILNSQNYADASPDKKQAYDQALQNADDILAKTTGPNSDQQAVEQAMQAVTNAAHELNGAQNLHDAQSQATQAIENAPHLNEQQKNELKGKVNQAQTVAAVTDLQNNANALNTAMKQLKQAIADHDTIVADGNYTNASPQEQGAYTDAYQRAQNLINGTPDVIINPADITTATQNVNNAEQGLNGNSNLANAKQEATNALQQMTGLSDAQRQSIQDQIDTAKQLPDIDTIKANAGNLNNAMSDLRQEVAKQHDVKASQPYVDANTSNQDDYNHAITNAESMINETTQPTLNPEAVTQALNQIKTSTQDLNGVENLNNAKQSATNDLQHLSHLNQAQQADLTQQLKDAPNVASVEQVKAKATSLDQAMEQLINAVNDKDQVHQSVNYSDADQPKQSAYDHAINDAQLITDPTTGSNSTQAEVEAALSAINTAKQDLNGNRKVEDAKNNANQALNNLNHLNNAQRENIEHQIDQAQTLADIDRINNDAQALNNAMGQLADSLNDKAETLNSQNYNDASPDKQHAYNDAVNHAQQLIDGVPNVIVSPSDIQNALNHVNQANNDLNGNANLINAKQQVTQALDQLPNLNQAQRDEFNKQINQALQVPDVNAIQQAAEKLNDAMTALKQGIANKDDIKGSENYHDADPDRQTAFDDAINHADTLLNEQNNPTMDPDTIKQALANVNEANHNLNGDQKLATAQQDAKTTLGTLDHLNQAQIDALTQQIDQAPDIAATNKIKQNAESLNNAMNQLDQALQTKADTLGSINYSDADQPKKDAYNDAVTLAESIVDHNSQNNASQDDIAQALKQLNDAKDALNGNSNVENAKQEAIEQINNAQDLNPAQKEALKQQVNLANTVNDVNQVKATTSNLDQAMSALKQGIADKDQTIADGNYTNANPDKQQAYSEAINHAEQIINGTPNAIVDPQAITNALHQVDQTKGDLNGNDNLHDAQQNASTLIDGLPNLNPAQKAALKEQVNQTSLVPSVDQIKQSANDLNTAMGNLNQTLQANAQVPQTIDYTQANNDKQTAYDNAVAQAQQVVNGNQVVQLSPDAVKQMTDAINHAKDDLNGDENLAQAKQDAKANLNTLPDLNQPQHDALTNQIEQAQTIEAVNQVKQQAQNVNDAMHNLKQGIANKDDILCSENYHDVDTDKQTAYQDAIRQAESIINQTVDPTLNPDDITQALTQVNLAKDDLNGDTKLTTEKQNATNDVNGMTHLNDAQKQALTSQIEHAPNIDAVNTAKQTAESLNNAMDQLEQAIHNKNQILADGNYLNADQAIQDAYNQAVGNAENVLNPQLGTNEDQSTIEAMTNKVNQAIQNLNGNSNLAQAKQDANQALTQLPHLNDAQRHDLETQIANAPLVTDVDSIKQNAQTLDQAMEHLRDSVKDNQQTLNSEDYHDATADRQNDYNNAVNDANQIINATTPVMNPTDINAAANLVNANKVALDGDENLTHAKQQATQTIDHLDHLNQAQIQQAQEGIAQATDIDAVTQHVRDAQALDNAMNQLQNAIANQNDVKQQSQFVNADPDKQSAYTDAVAHAQSIIDHQHGPNASQPEVEQALTQVQQALQNLNGEQRLQDSKLHAQQAIDGLADLNDPQKSALKEQVNHAPLITDVQQIEQQADSLNQAMHGLRQSIDDNAEVKASSAYINEDPTEQQNYDQAVQNAQDLINEQQATLDTNVINQTTESVNNSKQALQGVTKLQNEKDLAKERINQLPHLNDAQKHMEDALIDNETTRTAVKNDVTEAQQLDQYMDALQQSIADKQTTLDSSQYINADPNKKQDYDNAIQNAESIIAGITNPTINKDNVNQATESVNATKQALNGVEKLAEDKQHAGETMNQFNQLTPAQQQALNDAITDAQTRDEVAQKVAQAEALNNAMQALKDSIKR